MKLICELMSFDNLEVIKEDVEGKKVCKLKGPFMEADTRNKNGRTYPLKLMEREVKKYNEEKISKGRSLGELDHPENPTINLERVSHIVEALVMDKNLVNGVARLLDTPMGRIARTLIDEKIVLGMSSRGVGNLSPDGVVEDGFVLLGVDIVADPSAPSAFVEGVLENKEWIVQGDRIVEIAVANLKKSVEKKYDSKSMSNHVLSYMMKFLEDIRQKKM